MKFKYYGNKFGFKILHFVKNKTSQTVKHKHG